MIRTGVVTIIPSPPKRPSASARLFGALADLDRLCIEQYAPTDELAVVVLNHVKSCLYSFLVCENPN